MGSKTFLINKIWEVREKKKTNKHCERTVNNSYNSAFYITTQISDITFTLN